MAEKFLLFVVGLICGIVGDRVYESVVNKPNKVEIQLPNRFQFQWPNAVPENEQN